MNILYLCDEYPPGRHGGIGTAVRLVARQMVKYGHKTVVAGLYSPGYGGEDQFDDEGVTVYRFRRGLDSKWFGDQQSLPVRLSNRLLKDSGIMEWDIKRSLAAYKRKLEKIIIDYRIDIIEMPDYNDYIRFCNSYVPFPSLSVPVVVKMNGSLTYFTKEAGKKVPPHIVKMEQTILNQAAAVASASRYTADKSAIYLSYADEIEVVYNGIDTGIPAGNYSRDPKQVIFTGTLVAKKGIYQLAKAWNIVYKSRPDARLLVLGKGDQESVTAYLTKEAKETVTFLGHVETEKLYGYLDQSAISVFPSYAEAFALAPLEAMACGTAVINSNRTSGPELIQDHVTGLLTDPDDTGQIASAILYLLDNPAVCEQLAKAGNQSVTENFGIEKITHRHIEFYNKVLNGLKFT
jgi:glycosyltransferase involved in cell wall biosynthesis